MTVTSTFFESSKKSDYFPLNSLCPFFQAVIYETGENFDFSKVESTFRIKIHEQKDVRKDYIRLIESSIEEDNVLLMHIMRKSVPTWLANHTVSRSSREPSIFENVGNELVICFHFGNYLFVYCSCKIVEGIITSALDCLDPSELHLVRQEKIYKVLYCKKPEIRTLGMRNIFTQGFGGTVPEGKTYFDRRAENCLTKVFDSGFGFSYCVAHEERGVFGCSPERRKIWTFWVHGLEEFKNECQEIVYILDGNQPEPYLKYLVRLATIEDHSKLTPMSFFMDYSVHKKGLMGIEFQDQISFDWSCYLSEKERQVLIVRPVNSEGLEIKIRFALNPEKYTWDFSYYDCALSAKVIHLNEGEDEEDKIGKDLVEYLNKQKNFTVIFGDGIAYRGDLYWQDERFSLPYEKSEVSISWKGVDIRAEAKEPRENMVNILTRIKDYVASNDRIIVAVDDNGSNEIADIIAIGEKSIYLIHAKYSKEVFTGLRIDDLHVVCSQALKNIPYFWTGRYDDNADTMQRLFKNLIYNPGRLNFAQFAELTNKTLANPDTERECWIVQPGISKAILDKPNHRKHRAHSLMNFVDGICTTSSIKLRFFCSE